MLDQFCSTAGSPTYFRCLTGLAGLLFLNAGSNAFQKYNCILEFNSYYSSFKYPLFIYILFTLFTLLKNTPGIHH